MGEEADLLFTVPVVMPFWGLGEHEPLIIALCLPIVSHMNCKRLVFPQSPKGHNTRNSKKQVRLLPHIISPQKYY